MDSIDETSILSFVEITGANPDTARSYLTVNEGNLENAITMYFQNGGAELLSEQPPTPEPRFPPPSSSSRAYDADGVRAPIAPKREVLIGGDDDDGVGFYDPRGRRMMPPMRPAAAAPPPEPFRDFEHETSFVRGLRQSGGDVSEDRANRLANLFRPPLEIMFEGNFERARKKAQSEGKWVMVTIQDPTEFTCHQLNRDLWKEKAVKEVIQASFIFVMWGSESPEGTQHRTLYSYDNYPYIAIIDPLTAERVKVWNTLVSPAEFSEDVTAFLDSRNTNGGPSKTKKKGVMELTEEEQLELALAASMGGSGTVSDPYILDDEDEEVPEEEDLTNNEVAEPTPADVFSSIQPIKRDEPTSGDTARIQFRLPDGSRKVYKFLKTDPVRHLFEYVKAEVPEAQKQQFDLICVRDPLLARIGDTIGDAGLAGASVSVAFSEEE
ncbi:hypothetical protein HK104_010211 [Borealophlyctis nickersoniae]|nr:hypothetical protein HK104_010211 [Borealophlyctis nickersoniae]